MLSQLLADLTEETLAAIPIGLSRLLGPHKEGERRGEKQTRQSAWVDSFSPSSCGPLAPLLLLVEVEEIPLVECRLGFRLPNPVFPDNHEQALVQVIDAHDEG